MCLTGSHADVTASFCLAINAGQDAARLTHSHQHQYQYVLQSLTLWAKVC